MAWTAPTVRATGDLITASIYNTDLVNDIQYLFDTPAGQVAYAEIKSNATISATTEATANTIVTAAAVVFDGSTRVSIEMWTPRSSPGVNGEIDYCLYDGSTSIGRLGDHSMVAPATVQTFAPLGFKVFITPSAASHTYSWRAFRTTANGAVVAGVGSIGAFYPAFIRIARA